MNGTEVQVIKELVQLVGPAGAVVLILAFLLIYQRDKKHSPYNDVEAVTKVRETVGRIDVHVEDIVKDLAEVKDNLKETNGAFLRHLEHHP